MPQFVMEGREHAARAESPFVLGFIEALFFTERGHVSADEWFATEESERYQDGELPCDVGYTDIHPDSLQAIRADCEAWQAANADLLARAYVRPGYDEAKAGRDYWFTRNGHGVGFCDRKELESDDSEYERLTALIKHHAAAGDEPDDSKWQAAFDARARLPDESIGQALSNACGYQEVNVFFGNHVTHGDSPFVHVQF